MGSNVEKFDVIATASRGGVVDNPSVVGSMVV